MKSRPTLCEPMDCPPPGSSVHGILQAKILEWDAIPFSRESSNPGIKSRSPALQADSLPSEPPGTLLELKSAEGFLCELSLPSSKPFSPLGYYVFACSHELFLGDNDYLV